MTNCYKISPENLKELMTEVTLTMIDQLDKGVPILISPENWSGYKTQSTETKQPEVANECNCPVCSSKRAAMKYFASKYSKDELEGFFKSGELPDEVSAYLDSQIENYISKMIDDILGPELKTLPKERLIHVSEITDLPRISRYDTKAVVIDYHSSKSIPQDYMIISRAPSILKMINPDCPDYMIIGNLDESTTANLKKSLESYRYNQALISKIGDRAKNASDPLDLADLMNKLVR